MSESPGPINIDQTAAAVTAYLEAKRQPEIVVAGGEEFNAEFQFYAWGRLGRLLVEEHVDGVRNTLAPNAEFVYLDGCSSTPWLREVMRGQYRQESLKRTFGIVNGLEGTLRQSPDRAPFADLSREKINAIRGNFLKKGLLSRRMLETAVFQAIFDPDSVGVDVNKPQSIFDYFDGTFNSTPSMVNMEFVENGSKRGEKGSWVSMFSQPFDASLQELLTKVPLKDSEADHFLRTVAGVLADQLAGNIKKTSFVSMDITDAQTFKKHADRNFPKEILDTQFFTNVLDPERHIVGDIRDLSHFEDGTVGAYSIIEGFPFYKKHFKYDDGLQIASEACRVLVDGGKFMVFPWTALNARETDREQLRFIEEYMELIGFSVTVGQKDKDKLLEGMGQRELALVANSPIFHQAGDTLPFLVATKRAA